MIFKTTQCPCSIHPITETSNPSRHRHYWQIRASCEETCGKIQHKTKPSHLSFFVLSLWMNFSPLTVTTHYLCISCVRARLCVGVWTWNYASWFSMGLFFLHFFSYLATKLIKLVSQHPIPELFGHPVLCHTLNREALIYICAVLLKLGQHIVQVRDNCGSPMMTFAW